MPERARAGTAWRKLLALAFSTQVLAITDQGLVSGTNFLTTVAIGRFTPPSELGVYVLAMSLLITATNFQSALISQPYTLQRHRPTTSPAEHAGCSLALSVLLSLGSAAGVAAVAAGMALAGVDHELTALTAALAAVAPLLLLREFARDFGYARLQVVEVVLLDAVVAVIQFGALGCLVYLGRMSAVTALLCIGVACGAAAVVGLFLSRREFARPAGNLARTARQSWELGKWLLASLLSFSMQVQLAYWLIGALAGATAIGIYAACMSVASLANPLMTGLNKPMLAGAALALRRGGREGLLRATLRDALLLGAAMIAFCAVVLVGGERITLALFHSREYAGNHWTVVALALWHLAQALSMPPSNALSAMDRARTNFHLGLSATFLSPVLVVGLVIPWGSLGAGLGLLVGMTAACAMRWVVLLRLQRKGSGAMTVFPAPEPARPQEVRQ